MAPGGRAWIDSGVVTKQWFTDGVYRWFSLLAEKEINYLSAKIQAIGSGCIEEERDRGAHPHLGLTNTSRVYNWGQSHTWRTMHTNQ